MGSDLWGLRLVNQLCVWPQMLQGNVVPRQVKLHAEWNNFPSCLLRILYSVMLRLPSQNFALISIPKQQLSKLKPLIDLV